jgi:hypothetical protein
MLGVLFPLTSPFHPPKAIGWRGSEVAHERETVVVEVEQRELPGSPGSVTDLGAVAEDTLVLVFLEEQIRVVDDDAQHALTGCSGFEVSLELELQVELYGSAAHTGVVGLVLGVELTRLDGQADYAA